MGAIKMVIEGALEMLVIVGTAVKVLVGFLPFVFLVIIGYLIINYREELHYSRISGSRIVELDGLNKAKLRYFMLNLLQWLGYEELPPLEGHEGDAEQDDWRKDKEVVDAIVKKEENCYAVLVEKREKGVGYQMFKKLEYAMEKYNCNKGIIINTGYFNSYDQKAAGYGDIELWDRERLIRELLKLQGIEDTKVRNFSFHFINFFRWVWQGG